MESDFQKVRILDNFYQTSSFFPMPVVLISTLSESGMTNLGPYSLCFPHRISREHSMMLICRGNSNTALNIKRNKVCAINFIPQDKKMLKNCVMLGYPGETTEEKMANSIFHLIPSQRSEDERKLDQIYPEVVTESIQIFECTWNESYPTRYSDDPEDIEDHFVLRIDKIVMKSHWRDNLYEGKKFPILPIDYGFRNNTNFWFAKHAKPYSEQIPKEKGITLDSIIYATSRYNSDIKWQEEACAKLVKVPRIFLKTAIKGCVEAAQEEGLDVITPEFMDRIRDKRSKDKK